MGPGFKVENFEFETERVAPKELIGIVDNKKRP